jgi:hypothetical protein
MFRSIFPDAPAQIPGSVSETSCRGPRTARPGALPDRRGRAYLGSGSSPIRRYLSHGAEQHRTWPAELPTNRMARNDSGEHPRGDRHRDCGERRRRAHGMGECPPRLDRHDDPRPNGGRLDGSGRRVASDGSRGAQAGPSSENRAGAGSAEPACSHPPGPARPRQARRRGAGRRRGPGRVEVLRCADGRLGRTSHTQRPMGQGPDPIRQPAPERLDPHPEARAPHDLGECACRPVPPADHGFSA